MTRDFGAWFGVRTATTHYYDSSVLENRQDFSHATFTLRSPRGDALVTLDITAGEKPQAVIKGPTKIYEKNKPKNTKAEQIVIDADGKLSNFIIPSVGKKSPAPQSVNFTKLGNIWKKTGLSVASLITNDTPDYEAAAKALNRVASALDFTVRFEGKMNSIFHLQL